MAPNVSTGRKKEATRHKEAQKFAMMSEQARKMVDAVKTKISENCDYVGEKFAEEARAMHYGEKDERPIFGKTTLKEAADLADEGINSAPLPEPFVPDDVKETKKLN